MIWYESVFSLPVLSVVLQREQQHYIMESRKQSLVKEFNNNLFVPEM